MSIRPWKERSRETVFSKYSRSIVKVEYEMPNGKIADYYIRDEQNSVACLALTNNNMVICAKQFRPGPSTILYELPGGAIDENEDPITAGLRELQEETGYIGTPTYVGQCYSCAYSQAIKHVLFVQNCHPHTSQSLDEFEDIEACEIPLPEFRQLLRYGQISDVHIGYMALDFAQLL